MKSLQQRQRVGTVMLIGLCMVLLSLSGVAVVRWRRNMDLLERLQCEARVLLQRVHEAGFMAKHDHDEVPAADVDDSRIGRRKNNVETDENVPTAGGAYDEQLPTMAVGEPLIAGQDDGAADAITARPRSRRPRPTDPAQEEVLSVLDADNAAAAERHQIGSSMRIAIATLHATTTAGPPTAGNSAWMARMSFHNKVTYCKKWGYDLIIEDSSIVDATRNTAWSKILVLQKYLHRYDWIIWMDMDVVIMRYDKPLDDWVSIPNKDIIITKDWHGLNMGVFFMKNTSFSEKLLQDLWSSPKAHWHPWEEQSAFMYLVDIQRSKKKARKRMNHIQFQRQRAFNSYPQQFAYGNRDSLYQSGDFIAHFPNCKAIPNCRDTFTQFYNWAVRENDIKPLLSTDPVPSALRPAAIASPPANVEEGNAGEEQQEAAPTAAAGGESAAVSRAVGDEFPAI